MVYTHRSASSTCNMHDPPALPFPRSSAMAIRLPLHVVRVNNSCSSGPWRFSARSAHANVRLGSTKGGGPEAVVAFPRRVVAHSPSFILRTFTTKFAAQSSIVSNLGGLRDVHRVPIVRTGERALRAHPVGHPALVNALRRVAFEQLDALSKAHGLRRQQHVARVTVRRRQYEHPSSSLG